MTDLQVWVRVGDQDDYNGFDSLDEAADHLHESICLDDCHRHTIERHHSNMLVGLDVDQFTGQDAVSFYWGKDDAEYYAPLSDLDLELVQRVV